MDINKMVEIGGNRWQKGGKDRVYFSAGVAAELIGLRYDSYKTGNISSATLKGESISNSSCKSILLALTDANLYYDVVEDKFIGRQVSHIEYLQSAITAIRAL